MQTEACSSSTQQLAAELRRGARIASRPTNSSSRAQQLADRNVEVEAKNQEIEEARRAVEEKATDWRYPSQEFLANMSHSCVRRSQHSDLGQQLTENPEGNLSNKQVEFARTIHGAGTDLVEFDSDILDLSEDRVGTVSVDAEEVYFTNLLDMIGRTFRHEAENRKLQFDIAIDGSGAQHHPPTRSAAAGS